MKRMLGTVAALLCLSVALPAQAVRPREGATVVHPSPVATPHKRTPALTPTAPDALTRALAQGRIDPARYALERWASVWHPRAVRARFGDVLPADPHALTMLARDLQVRVGNLRGHLLARAQRLLARPTDGKGDPEGDGYSVPEKPPFCDAHVCIHYVRRSPDKVPAGDHNGNSIPDYVESAGAVMANVWQREVAQMGFRAPKSDLSSDNDGGNAKLDVYLADVGKRYYGYCQTDDPHLTQGSNYRYGDGSAYCVLDNDYAGFGYPDPLDPLKVTAAHEFFHAVQFAYDYFEDDWLLEGTASMMEDEVYDRIDDNLQYLGSSPLNDPSIPLDKDTDRVYGTWIFWRFLTEYFGSAKDHDISVLRDIFAKVDWSPTGPDQYSAQALANVVNARKIGGTRWHFSWAFADFGAWNASPKTYYEEGGKYRTSQVAKTAKITGSNPKVASVARLDHLTNRYVSILRGSGVRNTADLRVSIDGPASSASPEATALVFKDGGGVALRVISLDSNGNGSVTVGFGGDVRKVVVVTSNASVRFTKCYKFLTPYSCWGGVPVDDGRSFAMTATLIQ